MKVNYKRLKADLVSGVRKLGPLFLALKLDKFLLFDSFFDFSPLDFPDLDDFWDLADFWDLDIFWPSNLLVFGSTRFDLSLNPLLLPPTLSTSSAASILTPSTSLAASTCDDIVVFSIDVSGATILLKPLMNQQ